MSNIGTSSLGFAAYLQLKGHKLTKPPEKVIKTSGLTQEKIEKYNFSFDITQEVMNNLYDEFVTTEFYNYDSILHQLRKSISKTTRRHSVSNSSK
jgi:DNA topoisomerase IA